MKKVLKNTIIFTSVLILSLMTSIIFLGNQAKAASPLGDGSFSVEYGNIDDYYGKKAPTYEEGYLFAGWYADQECETPYIKGSGETLSSYYAKFVPQDVLSVKVQHEVALHNTVLDSETTGRIRFVTATDSSNYREVGLHVKGTIGSHTLNNDYKITKIYKHLYVVGTEDDTSWDKYASDVFKTEAAEYFAPYIFKISYGQFTDDFTVTPYWVTLDDVRVDGETRTRSMEDNLEAYGSVAIEGPSSKAYYRGDDLSEIYNTALEEASFVGTKTAPTVMTLLEDNLNVTDVITLKGNLRNLTIQSKQGETAKISRGDAFTDNMFVINSGALLILGTDTETGAVVVDGGNIPVATRTVYVKDGGSFVLQKNATLQNANSTASGAALVNFGTCELYGNMLNNVSSGGSSTAYGAGAILQCRGSSSLTIYGGTYTGNSNSGTYGGGGVIGTQTTSDGVEAGPIAIEGGAFSENSAAYGGVIFTYTTQSITISDGTFSKNVANTNGGVIATLTGTATAYPTIVINGGTFESNTAVTTTSSYGGVIWADRYCKLTIGGGTFTGNSATCGGVIRMENNGELIVKNSSEDAGKKIVFGQNEGTRYGAGVVFVGDGARATISDAVMTGNCAAGGNAAYYGGGAIVLHGAGTVTISGCEISGNTHVGALSDTAKNEDGLDIAFSGQGSKKTQTVTLKDNTSFDGIIGHRSNITTATLKLELENGSTPTLDYNTRYRINYDGHTLERVYDHRVILVSDMHYTTSLSKKEYDSKNWSFSGAFAGTNPDASWGVGDAFGYSQDEKIQAIFSDVNAYIAKEGAIDSLMILGDLSLDNKGYSNLKENYLQLFKENYLSKLSYPWFAIAGNHDSYTNTEWKNIIGTDRQYSVVVGNAVFIMLDTFEAVHAKNNSGSSYVGMDIEFLKTELAKTAYAGKTIFLCSHYYRPGEDVEKDAALQSVIAGDDRIVCMFRGHSHTNAVYKPAALNGRPLVDIGGYAYNSTGTKVTLDDGSEITTYNIFSDANAWGYQVLEWDRTEVHLYHVKTARKYTDYYGEVHDYAGAIEGETTIQIKK